MTDPELRAAFYDHKDAVYRFALRLTGSEAAAEDVAQDCFLELLRQPGRFDRGRGEMRAFLLGIARNLVLKRWRAESRWDPLDGDARATGHLPRHLCAAQPGAREAAPREPAAWSPLPLPRYPAPQTVRGGDTIVLDLLVNPATGQKIVDYLYSLN